MYLRVSEKRRGDRLYQYAQLCESYRTPDGMSRHRVVASLGALSEAEISNLRAALKASRDGRVLVQDSAEVLGEWSTRVSASLSYLDVAAALETWDRWKLGRLFHKILPKGPDAIAPSDVIAALVIHRCTSPGSKLYAQRWFPRTALPELLGVGVEQFNNSRIHRVLKRLDDVEDRLQAELAHRYTNKDGAFATLFMDVTDAWFEGRGPQLAERARTKEGFANRRKIGIVLVCNEHGYPVRWKTVPGKRRDAACQENMLELIRDEPWVSEVPLVCDRAMGRAMSVARLYDSGVRFLTATSRPEISAYTDKLPVDRFLELAPTDGSVVREAEIEAAARMAEEVGLEKIHDRLFCLDLGTCKRTLSFEREPIECSGVDWDPNELEGGASFIAQARLFQDRLDRRLFRNRSEIAAKEGLTRARVTQIMNTLRLDEQLQERILWGEFGYVPERLLRECVKCESEEEQRRLLEENARHTRPLRGTSSPRPPRRVGRQTVDLRLVAYFNPQMFVEHRGFLFGRRARVEQFVQKLNAKLRVSGLTRGRRSVEREIRQELARWKMLSLFDVRIVTRADKESGAKYLRVRLQFDEEAWLRRIRYSGFVLLVAHPDLPHSARQVVELYRKKDAVEKDFQTIKGAVKLRPMYHHTDPKVRAHVTLCMLALLLERTIERRLGRSPAPMRATRVFEEFEPGRLNVVRSDVVADPAYLLSELTQEQEAILKRLRMKSLADPEALMERLTPQSRA